MDWPRDPDNGMLIGPDDCHYDTEQEIFHFAVLGLCGCGDTDGAYNFCVRALQRCDTRSEYRFAEDGVKELVRSDPDMAAHVLQHLLTDKDVIEHGGSVGGSWLTDMGEAIVDAGEVNTQSEEP